MERSRSFGLIAGAAAVCALAPAALAQCPPGEFNYGPTYADPEAEQIALEMLGPTGGLLVNPDHYTRIVGDLQRIRMVIPALAQQPHDPVWVENTLIVGYTGEGLSQEVLCANQYYQVVNVQILAAIRMAIIRFPRNINFEALAVHYRTLAGVTTASPNGVLGSCPNHWSPVPQLDGRWRWTIKDREPDPSCAWCCTEDLWVIDTTLAGAVIIITSPGPVPCYANCDQSTTPPILNVEDFTCFINEFAAAQNLPHQQQLTHYANCDQSTTPPVLNVEDFTCFINRFAAGCP
jgi:hypothetical protein